MKAGTFKKCKSCARDIPIEAKVCWRCGKHEKWYRDVRISDILLLLSLGISFLMVILSFLNFQESKTQRSEASEALRIARSAGSTISEVARRIKDTETEVLNAKNIVEETTTQIKKMEQSTTDANNKVKQLQKSFQANLASIREETAILALYYDAKAGERLAYNKLVKASLKSDSRTQKTAKSLSNDASLYLKDYKISPVERELLDSKTKKYYREAAEDLYQTMYEDKYPEMREAAINEIRQRKFKYFVQDLVTITRNDPNLKVAGKAVRAIEFLAGQRFEDGPLFNDVERWWNEAGKKEKIYYNFLHRMKEIPKAFTLDKSSTIYFPVLDEITHSGDGLCRSHTTIAYICYFGFKNTDRARHHIKIAMEQCDQQHKAMILSAIILDREGKKNEALDILFKIDTFIHDKSELEKACYNFMPDLVNEERFKKLFGK